MRILHLSWEYPPLVYGGLGRHVHALAEAQAQAGHDVVVITQWNSQHPTTDERVNGVRIIRAPVDPPVVPFDQNNLLAWVLGMEHAFTRAGLRLAHDWEPDIIHGHDWLVAHASAAMKDVFAAPLVATIHATEAGRHQGWLPTELSRSIHMVEWWLTFEARRVITCSSHMRWEAGKLFELPPHKTDVIPNGIDLSRWQLDPAAIAQARNSHAGPDSGPLLVFAGRLEWEKGVHTILEAMPRLRRRHPGIRLLIAGQGSQLDALKALSRKLRLGRSVQFLGFLQERELKAVVAAADVALAPSIYEPFGLVALEAAALNTPLVLSDTGGLLEFAGAEGHPETGEIIEGEHAMVFRRGDKVGLAAAVTAVLDDQVGARRRVKRAREALERDHTWPGIADETLATYLQAREEEIALMIDPRSRPEIVVPEGNLFTGARA